MSKSTGKAASAKAKVTESGSRNSADGGKTKGKNGGKSPFPFPETFRLAEKNLPQDPVALITFLAGTAVGLETARASNQFMEAVALARIRDLFKDPQMKTALAKAGYRNFKDVAKHLAIDSSTAYEMVRNVRLLGEAFYRRAELAGLTRTGYRVLRELPPGKMKQVQRLLDNPEGRTPDQVKAAVDTVLEAYGREHTRADEAERREKRAKTELEKDRQVRLGLREKLQKMTERARDNEAAVNDIPVTLLGRKVSHLSTTCLDLADSLDKARYDDHDRRNLRRLGGRVHQVFDVVMRAFDRAVPEEEWLPDAVVEGGAAQAELARQRARSDEIEKMAARDAEQAKREDKDGVQTDV